MTVLFKSDLHTALQSLLEENTPNSLAQKAVLSMGEIFYDPTDSDLGEDGIPPDEIAVNCVAQTILDTLSLIAKNLLISQPLAARAIINLLHVEHEKQADTKQLSAAENFKYLTSGFNHCPNCYSTEVEGGSVNIDGNMASQECLCHMCGAEWEDEYTLSGVTIQEEGEKTIGCDGGEA